MFQFDWATKSRWKHEDGQVIPGKAEQGDKVQRIMLLQWQEHCVECAIPLCYRNCPLYVPRRDQKCARFVYGIVRNTAYRGLFGYGADLRFRRWGKLEAQLTGRSLSLGSIRLLDLLDRMLTAGVNLISFLLGGINRKRRLNGAWTFLRDRLFPRIGRRGHSYDEFVLECYNPQTEPCRLIVELKHLGLTICRKGIDLQYGMNRKSIHLPFPSPFSRRTDYLLSVYPDADKEIRLVFTCLDLVVSQGAKKTVPEPSVEHRVDPATPAAKIKCVAWDLDNTLWKGTLIEDGKDNVRISPEAEHLIRWLDEHGILQTIASKNDHAEAMNVLKKAGLEDFFLYPAINWEPKSANLRQIADHLNINIDTFGLIDDSAFERGEVSAMLPMVRVYPESDIEALHGLPEFDVPVTETSRMRRTSYVTEMRRDKAREIFGGNYRDYLRSCGLKIRIFTPTSEKEVARCLELIQRSNQLNLSSRRYNAEEFAALLASKTDLTFAISCEDRYGDYGIVAFVSVDVSGDQPMARDFVMSCRVAQKHVEHAFYGWLGDLVKQQGATKLRAHMKKTDRNGPLAKVFEDLRFTVESAGESSTTYVMELDGSTYREDIIMIDDASVLSREQA